jgi:nitroreductase/dihydropteridine reductase
MDIVSKARQRYTVKSYDRERKVPADVIEQLREVLRLAPSSVNSQPWHFVVASTPEGKERIAKAADAGYQYNAAKIRDASHVIVLATKVAPDDAHLAAVLAQEEKDGRFVNEAAKASQHNGRMSYTNLHRFTQKDVPFWYEKQTYIALGNLLQAAALLDVGATPMEGFNGEVLDKELGLRDKGFAATVIVSLGYSSNEDFNAKLAKSRLPAEQVFTDI